MTDKTSRRQHAGRARDTVRRMQLYLRELKKRSYQFVPDPAESRNYYEALTRADDVLQTLWVHLHYMSYWTPLELYEREEERRKDQQNVAGSGRTFERV